MRNRLKWTVTALVAAAALLIPVGGARAGGEPTKVQVKDDRNDVVDCRTNAPADTKANDIDDVKIYGDGRIRVRMFRSVERSLKDQFSFAVVVTVTYPDGRVRAFRVQVHEGVVQIGEIDPDTREPLPEGGPIDVKNRTIVIETLGSVPAGTTVLVESFNLPEEGDEPDVSCDDVVLDVTEQLRPPTKIAPPDEPPAPEPPREGPVEDLEEIIA